MESLLCRTIKHGLIYAMIVGISIFNLPLLSVAAPADPVNVDPVLLQSNSETTVAEVVEAEISNISANKEDVKPALQTDAVAVETDPGMEAVPQAESVVVETDPSMEASAPQAEPVAVETDPGMEAVPQAEPVVVETDPSMEAAAPLAEPVVVETDPIMEAAAPLAEPVAVDSDPGMEAAQQPEPVVIETDSSMEPTQYLDPIVVETDPDMDTAESLDGMTMLYLAGGALAVGAVVLMAGDSGGSDSTVTTPAPSVPAAPSTPSAPAPAPEPEEEQTVGPDMNGSWRGTIKLLAEGHEGSQGITAKVVHRGSSIKMSTSSTLDYGRSFSGSISGGGYMTLYDAITGKIWTTHKGSASSRQMELYDYVNGNQDYDRISLRR